METDFDEYLTLLNENKEDLSIFISANGEMTGGHHHQILNYYSH